MNAPAENPEVLRTQFQHILGNLPVQQHTQITPDILETLENLTDEEVELVMGMKNSNEFLKYLVENNLEPDDPKISAMMVFINKKPKKRVAEVESVREDVTRTFHPASTPDLGSDYEDVHPALKRKAQRRANQ